VIIGIEEYRKILEEREDLDDVRAYDKAKAAGGETVLLEQALEEVPRDQTCAAKH
jgi:hypothetical protein